MRSLIATLAAVLISLSTAATADDQKDCTYGSSTLQIDACTRILQSDPRSVYALGNRGIGYREIGQFDLAITDFCEALRISPNNPSNAGLYLERGLAYQGRGSQTAAIADFTEAIGRDRSLIGAYFARAMAYGDAGQTELLAADLDQAMRLDRRMVAALYMQRGDALRTAHLYDQAVAAFDKAIDLNPTSPTPLAYCGRAASYDEKGDAERAIADYRTCLEFTTTTDLVRQRQQFARERLENLTSR